MEQTPGKAGSTGSMERELVPPSVQEFGQEDDVIDQSPFTVAEIWAWVPRHVQEEVFDHLDIRQATRLTRVSTSWANEMKDIPKRNKGIALLENLATTKAGKFIAANVNGEEAVPGFALVSHLVLISTIQRALQYEKCRFVQRLLPSLRKVTLGEPFIGNVANAARRWEPWRPFTELFIFRKWTLELSFVFSLDNASEQVIGIFQKESERYKYGADHMMQGDVRRAIWGSFKFDCLQFDVPGSSGRDGEPMKRIWRLLECQGMLWPYPQEQTHWLLKSLNSLRRKVLKTVRFLDRNWMDISHDRYSDSIDARFSLGGLNVTSKGTCDRRQLRSLDLAFLGRLLVFLDKKVKIPGLELPPFPFSTELEFVRAITAPFILASCDRDLICAVVYRPAQ